MKMMNYLYAAAVAVIFSLGFSSCSSSDSSKNDGPNPTTPKEQKAYMETVAQELLSQVSASDFDPIRNLAEYVKNNITRASSSSSKTQVIDDFFENAVKACTQVDQPDYVKYLFIGSNFAATFRYDGSRWQQVSTGGNSLQFLFTDDKGQQCSAIITKSGNEKEVHSSLFDEVKNRYVYDGSSYTPITKTTEYRFVVPEKVTATLTQGDATLATVDVSIDISGLSNELNFQTDFTEVTVYANILNYTLAIDRLVAKGGGNASINVDLSKNGNSLISADVYAENVSATITDRKVKDWTAGRGVVNIDVLGKIQVMGTVSNIRQFADAIEETGSYTRDEAKFKSSVEKVNNMFDVGVYYSGNTDPKSYFKLYPFSEEKYGETRWNAEPVIYFSDGSSYSTLKDFFDKDTFNGVIKKFEQLVTDFRNKFTI